MEKAKKLNRFKTVFAEVGQTNKWLAEQHGKNSVAVSKWCTITAQPDLQILVRISDPLDVDLRGLLASRKYESL